MKLRQILTALLSLSCILCMGQQAFQDIKIRQFTAEDGLADNSVRALFKDSRGFIWVGLNDGGLFRYDGHEFRHTVCEDDVITLPADAHITNITEDGLGHLWIECSQSDVACFDTDSGKFIKYREDAGGTYPVYAFSTVTKDGTWLWNKSSGGCIRVSFDNEGKARCKSFSQAAGTLPSDRLFYITGDSSGATWIGTRGGLLRVDGDASCILDDSDFFFGTCPTADGIFHINSDGTIYIEQDGQLDVCTRIPVSGGKVFGLFKKKSCWFISTQTGCYEFNFRSRQLSPVTGTLSMQNAECRINNEGDAIAYNRSGNILFYDARSDSSYVFKAADENMTRKWGERYRFSRSADGMLWVASRDGCLLSFNPADSSVSQLKLGATLSEPLADILVCVLDDGLGNIWAGSQYAGLIKISTGQKGISYLHFADELGIPGHSDMVTMVKNISDEVWVSTADGLLQIMDSNLEGIHIENRYGTGVSSAIAMSDGTVVVGTTSNGLFINDTNYRSHFSAPGTIGGDNVYDLAEDAQHRIWVALREGGLNTGTKQMDQRYEFKRFFDDSYPVPRFRSLLADNKGRIWAGSDVGLFVFYPERLIDNPDAYRLYNTVSGDLRSNEIDDIMQDSQGRIWIAETGSGFCLAETNGADSVSFKHFSTRDGLTNNMVRSISEDKDGRIWLMTDIGMSSFDHADLSFYNYHFSNKLQSNTHRSSASLLMPDGRILSGTRKGLLIVDPTVLKNDLGSQPRTRITSFMVNGERLSDSRETNFKFKYNQNYFEFGFSSLNFRDGASYSYMLEGYDRRWSSSSSDNKARYSNVPPGRYVFRVRSAESVPETESSISIRIRPPWYLSIWAMLLYLALIIVVIWSGIRSREKMNRLKTETEIQRRMREFKLAYSKEQDKASFLSKMQEIIEKHLSDTDFSVDIFASEMAMSRSSFYAKVNSLTGLSPNNYIKYFRLEKAASLILDNRYTIEQAAGMVGFHDASYFTKLFKAEFGMTPKEYKSRATSSAALEKEN